MPAKRKPSRYVEVRGEYEYFKGSQLLTTTPTTKGAIDCAQHYWRTGTYQRVTVQSFPDKRIVLDLSRAMRYAIAQTSHPRLPWRVVSWSLGKWPQSSPPYTINDLRVEVRRLKQLGYQRDRNVPLIKGA